MSSLTMDDQDLRDDASPAEQRRGLLAACEVALEAARSAGATEAEAFAGASVEATCQLEGPAIKLTRENAHQALGLRNQSCSRNLTHSKFRHELTDFI